MTTTQYQNFVTVAECRSITLAAKELMIAQPALTSQIKRLEEMTGLPLFIRHPRSVELTEAGKIFYQSAKSILQIEENARIGIENLTTGGGPLNIGITLFLPDRGFQMILENYYEKFPGAAISLYEENTLSLLSKLEAGVIELAMVVSSRPLPPQFQIVASSVGHLYVCRKEGSPWFTHIQPGQAVSLTELNHIPISAPRNIYRYIDECCQQLGVNPSWKAISDSRHATLDLARAGNITAVLALRKQTLKSLDMLCNRISDDSVDYHRCLVRLQGRELSIAAKNFLDTLDFNYLDF
ncbi:LysR family transcriptional regulator [Lachnospiraceae bacterium 62-35]